MVKKHIAHRLAVVALLLAAFCVPFVAKHSDLSTANANVDAYAVDALSHYGSRGSSSNAQTSFSQSTAMDTAGNSFVGSSLQQ